MTPRVLIVDDSLTVRMNLAEMLRADGCRAANSAPPSPRRGARWRPGRSSSRSSTCCCPTATASSCCARFARGPLPAPCPVMLLSTEAEVRDRIRGLATGADEYVGKPYDPGYVLARARELMRRGRAPAEPGRDTVLIIDDSVTFRERMKQVLEQEGYAVLLAGNGGEGLRLAAEARPSAIVVDGVLPDIDGATVIRRIRLDAALRRTPCLVLTGVGGRGRRDPRARHRRRRFRPQGRGRRRHAGAIEGGAARHRCASAITIPPASWRRRRCWRSTTARPTCARSSGNLLQEGFDVVLARSGEEALDLLAVQPVDCILLDLMMPGIGGTETCRRVKAAPGLRDTPIVMLTAREDREAMIEGLGAGADDYIAKSSDFAVLRARVRGANPPQAVRGREPALSRAAAAEGTGDGAKPARRSNSPRRAPRWPRNWNGRIASSRRSAIRCRTICGRRCAASTVSAGSSRRSMRRRWTPRAAIICTASAPRPNAWRN